MTEIKRTVGFFTLGCKVNQYESEAIGELFEARGYTVLPSEDVCDVYIINTCTVTAESDRKARQMIRRAITRNPDAFILVTGCLAQTAPESITRIPGVDYVCGNADKTGIVDVADRLMATKEKNCMTDVRVLPLDGVPFEPMKIRKFDRTRAYIKIEDGCESHCTYCIIPAARGAIRSKPPAEVLAEVRSLTDGGCREIVLTGIETASYGKDLNGVTLADLLEEVDRIPGIGRIRLGSLDPSLMKPPFVERISRLSSLAPHFHLSVQSGSDAVLRRMRRKYNSTMALENIKELRRVIPNLMLTTDIIVGFPGETEEDFEQTMEFARLAEFLRIHVFPYSGRRGTPAVSMSGQISSAVKHERVLRLSNLEAEIRRRILEKEIAGHAVADVLFETYENGFACGHTANFIEVRVKSNRNRRSELCPVRLLETDGNTITAELL